MVLLGLSVRGLGARPEQANCLLGGLLNLSLKVHEQDRLSVDFATLEGACMILQLVDGGRLVSLYFVVLVHLVDLVCDLDYV